MGLIAYLGWAGINLLPLCAQTTQSSSSDSTSDANGLPPYIMPSSPLAQVIRLVQAGVEEDIIRSYVSNSISTFNLDSDKIIYLSDVGVPGDITTAMMARDQVLQQEIAAAQPPPDTAPPAPPPPSSATDTTDLTDTTPPPDSGPVTVNYFYASLAPYGSWIDIAGYGRCWRPTVVIYNHNWQPYCDRGHWIFTDGGWYWESEYAWATTFHYGRWFRDSRLGWCWWPDTVWAPSWVTWRYTDDYCGWAPLPPFAVFQPGYGFIYRGYGISAGFDFGLAEDCFTFVPNSHFCDWHPRRYRCEPQEVGRFYGHTSVVNNLGYIRATVVNAGLPARHFNAAGGTPIRPLAMREMNIPPSFTQHPEVFHPHRPEIQRNPNLTPNNSSSHFFESSPGQNPGSPTRYPAVTQRPEPNRPWSPAPVPVVQSPDRNYNNLDPRAGHPVTRQYGQPTGNAAAGAPPWFNPSPSPNGPRIHVPQQPAPADRSAIHQYNNQPAAHADGGTPQWFNRGSSPNEQRNNVPQRPAPAESASPPPRGAPQIAPQPQQRAAPQQPSQPSSGQNQNKR